MKKIINGKLYDTDTAREVAIASNGRSGIDRVCEILYRKRTGEYFLHGEGGAATRYGEASGDNQWTGSSKILPLSLDAARKWAESHMDADEYQAEFGPVPEEDNSRVTLSISLDAATADRIRKAAQQAGASVSALISSKFQA